MLLFVGLLVWTIDRDSDPGGVGEPSTGLIPGAVTASGWHRSDTSFLPDGFGFGDPGFATPEALIDTMTTDARSAADAASWIRGEILTQDDDAAKARVYLPLPEHARSTAGAELLLEMSVKDDGWYVEDADVRFHCRRAVRDGLCG